MKSPFSLLVLLICISCNQRPDSSASSANVKKDSTVNKETENLSTKLETLDDIKKEHNAILSGIKDGSIDSVAYQYNCHEEKRGTITFFKKEEHLQMVKHSYGEYDHHEASDQYFVKDSALFFVFLKQLYWSFDSASPEEGGTQDKITEKRIYILNGQAMQCLEKNYVELSYSKTNPNPATIANKEVKCTSLKPIKTEFEKLLMFEKNKGKGCPFD